MKAMSSAGASQRPCVPEAPEAPAEAGVVFVIPPGRPPSGGDLYNRFLLRALRAEGSRFGSTTLDRLETGACAPGTEFWVDSLYIRALAAADPFGPDDRLFFIVHSLPSEDPGVPPKAAAALRLAEDSLFGRAEGFLVTGPRTRKVLEERGFAGRPILLVPPAPCVLPKGPPKAPEAFSGLIVSSLIRGKGVPGFLEALGRLARADDAFAIRIAGRTDIEPDTAAACLKAIGAHPVLKERVVHMGFIPYEEMGGEYERSSVLISPSPNETFGMAFHEARAFGLPILALRAAYSEPFITQGQTGLLFDSAAELARGTLELVRQPGRLRDLAAAAAESRTAVVTTWAGAARAFLSQRRTYAIVRPGPGGSTPPQFPTKAMRS
jgi:glycosyltransferase involved in cell wall biosynthesis